eukprot:gene25752-8157_t
MWRCSHITWRCSHITLLWRAAAGTWPTPRSPPPRGGAVLRLHRGTFQTAREEACRQSRFLL